MTKKIKIKIEKLEKLKNKKKAAWTEKQRISGTENAIKTEKQ